MIQIYGPKNSSAGRSLWTLEECGVAYENVPVNLRERENTSEAFLKLNPNGKVPVLVDGDFVLFESMAINTYLAEKYKPELLGKNIEEHGLVYQWSYWSTANLAHAFEVLILAKFGVPTPEDRMQEAREKVTKYLTLLNTFLNGKSYMVGESFTLADINVASVVSSAGFVEYDLTPFANIRFWLEKQTSREVYKNLMG